MTTRRLLVQGMIATGASGSMVLTNRAVFAHSRNQQATPSTPDAETPEAIVLRLRETPITSPLFPRDAGDLAILDWVDDSDTDLANTVGAFLVQGPAAGDDGSPTLGAYMVHPTAESALAQFTQQPTDGDDELPLTLFGYTGGWGNYPDGTSLVAVAQGFVIVSAMGMGPQRGPDEPGATDFREADARALANLAGMLDHLRMVVSTPE